MNKKRAFLGALALFFCLSCLPNQALAMGSRPKKQNPTIIKGHITDSRNNQPLSEARVRLFSILGSTLGSATSNSVGDYELKSTSLSSSGIYLLNVRKTGYKDKTQKYYLNRSKTYTINVGLNFDAPAGAPLINSISPMSGSEFLAGAQIEIKVAAQDPANNPLEYRFSVGGTIVQPWSTSDTYLWQTSPSDKALVGITCEVRNNQGKATSQSISLRIIDPTVEEILQKVADNYAKIQDFKADMFLSSTLDGKPFGETQYCRYYFKAPDKEKTETFSDETRTIKTDIIIIEGPTMHLINPVKNIKEDVDLLKEMRMDIVQFGEMNLYYDHESFMQSHIVTKDLFNSDFDNMILSLDVIPERPNNIYEKLNISIDYSKGVITKYLIYKKNKEGVSEIVQDTRTVESQRMPNGAWLPVKMTKTPNLSAGDFISTLIYVNPQVNIGLTDFDFKADRG